MSITFKPDSKDEFDCPSSWNAMPLSKEIFHSGEDIFWLPELLNDVRFAENDYSVEWKEYLLMKNSEEINGTVNLKRFIFYTPKIVKCVFDICKMLRQPPEVRYLAADILDRFLCQHFLNVSETFEQMENDCSTNWQIITERLLQQSLLRILTCIQLAVKYTWTCKVITATNIQEVMEYFGNSYQFSKRSIHKSEARIYQTLNCNASKTRLSTRTPLTYLEMFFENFQKQQLFLMIDLHKFFCTCIHVLDIAIVYHEQVYSNFIKFFKSSLGDELGDKYCPEVLKADFMILAASVIFAAGVLEDPNKEILHDLVQSLCSVGECRKSYIQSLGKQILNIILR